MLRNRVVAILLGLGLCGVAACVVSSYHPEALVRGALLRLHLRGPGSPSTVTGTFLEATTDSLFVSPGGLGRRQGYARAALSGLDVRKLTGPPATRVVVWGVIGGGLGALAGYGTGRNDGTLTVGGWTFVGAAAGAVVGTLYGMQAGAGAGVEKWVAVDLEQFFAAAAR